MLDSMGRMAFGKYKGKMLCDVPGDYLIWMIENDKKKIETLEEELERRKVMEEAEETIASRIIDAGYRALAVKFHPDKGGDPEDFRKLTASKEILKQMLEMLDKEESSTFGETV